MCYVALPISKIISKLKFRPFCTTIFGTLRIRQMQLPESDMKTVKSKLDVLEAQYRNQLYDQTYYCYHHSSNPDIYLHILIYRDMQFQ